MASALSLQLPGPEIDRLKLVKSGVALTEDADVKKLQEAGKLIFRFK